MLSIKIKTALAATTLALVVLAFVVNAAVTGAAGDVQLKPSHET